MKLLLVAVVTLSLGVLVGVKVVPIYFSYAPEEKASSNAGQQQKPLYWVAPMDKNYRRDKPGQSPMGMDLVPVYAEDQQSGETGLVKISPMVVNNLGVRTEKVSNSAIDMPIHTVGYVAFDEDQLSHIHSRVDGWIEVLNVASEGDAVTKNQTLYELYSPALVNAQEEYLAALRSGNEILKSASKTRLLSLGFTQRQASRLTQKRVVSQRVKVIADRSGFVEKLNVRQGMFIKPAMDVMSIGSLDSVWIIAEVFERQANWVKPGQSVEMRLDALPGKLLTGKVDYLYPVLDSKTRTLRVRVRVDNPDFELRPNMYVDLTILAPVAKTALSVPREAVIKAGKHTRVVKALGDGQFKAVLVEVGIEAGDSVQILGGLSKSDVVVTSAQFLIDSESNIEAELARMQKQDMSELAMNMSTMGDVEMAQQDVQSESSKRVIATGKVNKVMPDMKMVNITHDPIVDWEWPTMKMDFMVNEDINLENLAEGQNIVFELEQQGEWDYLITEIKVN